jgi:phosphoribosyl-ATP pyrophosphohydrolase/phosphoribosyl-AMP cyclohydrolase
MTQDSPKPTLDPATLDFDKGGGLVVVVAQDARTHAVLMVAFADREAILRTLTTGDLHFFSRTRGLWRKGETSGNTLRVVELRADCDRDAVLARVEPAGPACHTGTTTCWGEPTLGPLQRLERVIHLRATEERAADAAPSYTKKLLADRNLRLKKIGEEAGELLVALADANDETRIAEEAADLAYHVMVALEAAGVPLDRVREVLARRAK